MSRFVRVDDKYVNLHHVMYISERWKSDGTCVQTFYGADREPIAASEYLNDLDFETAEMVAAALGTTALLVISDVSDRRATIDDVDITEAPVIAWRIDDMGASPVFIEKPASNQTVLHKLPGGRFLLPHEAEFSDLDAAKEYLLKQAQDDWDRRQKPAVKSDTSNSPS